MGISTYDYEYLSSAITEVFTHNAVANVQSLLTHILLACLEQH